MQKTNKFICHRGNLWGPDKTRENKIYAIEECINLGMDVEIDIFAEADHIFLGHDYKQEEINVNFLIKNKEKLWIHCKNLYALSYLRQFDLNYFYHQTDDYTLTSKKFIWTYPKKNINKDCIIVCQTLKETKKYIKLNPFKICTDYCRKNILKG